MPYRREVFAVGDYYHILNRSVASEKIFINKPNLIRAIELINFYRFPTDISFSHLRNFTSSEREMQLSRIVGNSPLVEILAFSLMSTHFHFVLRQKANNGTETFLRKFQGGFGQYYNISHKRHGAVFSNRFKVARIESNSQLIHVVRYVELNPVTGHSIEIDDLPEYPYTSFTTYMGIHLYPFVSTEIILNHFRTKDAYKNFVFNQADYQRNLAEIKRTLLD